MSFTLSNSIDACCGRLNPNLLNKCNAITGVVDLTLLAVASVVGGLMLGGVLKFGLPMGVGTIGHNFAWGCVGVAGSILVANTITAIVIANRKVTNIEALRQFQERIMNTPETSPTKAEINADLDVPCHQVVNGVYIGNSEAFAQSTYFECRSPNGKGILQRMVTSNPLSFTTVITACPLNSIFRNFMDLKQHSVKDFSESFTQHDVSWHYVGKMVMQDDPSYWETMVYDCTVFNTELAKKTLPEKCTQSDVDAICKEKKTALLNIPVHEWFEPIFKEIDEGVTSHKKVLVHCQAGQSRSATILAAYLINRFLVSSDQAITFLKSKRRCVEPQFADQLNAYAQALIYKEGLK